MVQILFISSFYSWFSCLYCTWTASIIKRFPLSCLIERHKVCFLFLMVRKNYKQLFRVQRFIVCCLKRVIIALLVWAQYEPPSGNHRIKCFFIPIDSDSLEFIDKDKQSFILRNDPGGGAGQRTYVALWAFSAAHVETQQLQLFTDERVQLWTVSEGPNTAGQSKRTIYILEVWDNKSCTRGMSC